MESLAGPKAQSVKVDGSDDDWQVEAGWRAESDPGGSTRLVVAVPTVDLLRVHEALVRRLSVPLGVLYRQKVDRRAVAQGATPVQGAPPRDFVSLELPPGRVLVALQKHSDVIHHDARCEVWVRGKLGDQVVIDSDGMLFAYPDDPAFREVLDAVGLTENEVQTLETRDYVKHWFHGEADAAEDGLIADLHLQEVPHRK